MLVAGGRGDITLVVIATLVRTGCKVEYPTLEKDMFGCGVDASAGAIGSEMDENLIVIHAWYR